MPAPHNSADSPVMRQYLEIKGRYPDAVLMFRMGDFYEMFFEDAVTVAPLLGIALTTRDRNAPDPVPMAGVPYHALGGYLRTLVERGIKVAICEQMERPEDARRRKGPKIVRREVVRVVTPGALVDEEHLRGEEPNYLLGLARDDDGWGLCALDISSGDFLVCAAADEATARAELCRLAPREILASSEQVPWIEACFAGAPPRVEVRSDEPGAGPLEQLATLAEQSGVPRLSPALERAAGWTLEYAEKTQPGQTLLLHRLRWHEPAEHLVLDETSARNLEIFKTLRDQERRGSLLWAMDETRTPLGARMLREWLGAPLRDPAAIAARQDAVEALVAEPAVRDELRSRLRDVRDVLRLASRARLGTITPRELGVLRGSLQAVPDLAAGLAELRARRTDGGLPALLDLGEDLLGDLCQELARVLVDDPPAALKEGGVVREGADPELDRQRALRDGGRQALADIEARERERTGIPSLKVLHNRVFGYFIEVSRAHLKKVPKDYVRKQTLANAERFVTEELAGHEAAVLGAQARALAREQELLAELRARVSDAGPRLCALGEALGRLDVLAAFAQVAERHGYVRPQMVSEPILRVEQGRHPVIERLVPAGSFVPNDIDLRAGGVAGPEDAARLWIVTGPNMGGKSTVMRQAALITLLAHTGSFVPAEAARVGLCDRIFTRVGAADDLGRGESTFMVEMREAAQILRQATGASLVLLDELGRGTATYDGLSLAWAVAEHLHDQIGCRTMFATHYHELCALEGRLPGVRNMHVTVHESRGTIVFLHRLAPGAAGRSYGIQVGRLAGLPRRVLTRARRILERLEQGGPGGARDQLDLFAAPAPSEGVPPEVPPGLQAILDELEALDPDDLTPRQAWERLAAWVERLRAEDG